ncbi:MAG: hypothetical protein K9L62_02830 [Vallitaleaceae bacterium]|nr:hypothetical protein [Vallitaleaceae bacterium]
MEVERQKIPRDKLKQIAEALTQFGISLEEAEWKIQSAIQGFTEVAKKVVAILRTTNTKRLLKRKKEPQPQEKHSLKPNKSINNKWLRRVYTPP